VRQAAALAAKITGGNRSELYRMALEMTKGSAKRGAPRPPL
jgi:hypothetical protein